MATDLELFSWHKVDGGFAWRDATALMPDQQVGLSESDKAETKFLMPRAEPARGHRYDPLKEKPTLHREFAALSPTDESFEAFASMYGDLGVGVMVLVNGTMQSCDPRCRWRAAHMNMRRVVEVLTAIEAKDSTALARWFVETDKGYRYDRDDEFGRTTGWVTLAGELRPYVWTWAKEASSPDEQLLRVASGWAQDRINEALSGRRAQGSGASPRVVYDVDRKQMTIRVVPDTLLGAMWFQCARVLALRPTFRQCARCGKWFEVSSSAEGSRRKQAIYCSDACKVAVYRARKAQAKAAAVTNT